MIEKTIDLFPSSYEKSMVYCWVKSAKSLKDDYPPFESLSENSAEEIYLKDKVVPFRKAFAELYDRYDLDDIIVEMEG